MRKSFDLPHNKKISTQGPSHGVHITIGTLQGFAASSLSLPTGILTAAFLSRTLNPTNYGALTVSASIIIWIEGAINIGFNRTAEKLVAEVEDWRPISSRLLQVQLIVSFLVTLILVLVAPILARWLDNDEISTYLRLFSIGIPFSALFKIQQSILVGRGYFGNRASLIAFYWMSRMILIFVFVGYWPSVMSAVLALVLAHVLSFMGSIYFIKPAFLGDSSNSSKNLWDIALPIFFYAIGISLFNRIGLFFVKGMSGISQDAGFYGAAQNLTIVPALFMTSLSPLLLSKLSQVLSQGQKEAAKKMVQKAVRLTLSLLPFAGLAAGAAAEVVLVIYGQMYISAGGILAILIFAAVGVSIITVSTAALIAADRSEMPFYLILPILLLAIGALFIIVPRFGSIGAAWVTTILSWIGALSFMLALYKIWGVRLPVATIFRSITICVVAYIMASRWQTPDILILLKIPLISLFIVIAITLLGEFSRDEIIFLRSVFNWRSRSNQDAS
jgi:O-antigen/teichoic acid export membrane protein